MILSPALSLFFSLPSLSRCISFLSLPSRCLDSHSRRRGRLVVPNKAPLCPPLRLSAPPRLLSPSHSFCLLLCFTFISAREKSETERRFVFSTSFSHFNSAKPPMLNATRRAEHELHGAFKASLFFQYGRKYC